MCLFGIETSSMGLRIGARCQRQLLCSGLYNINLLHFVILIVEAVLPKFTKKTCSSTRYWSSITQGLFSIWSTFDGVLNRAFITDAVLLMVCTVVPC